MQLIVAVTMLACQTSGVDLIKISKSLQNLRMYPAALEFIEIVNEIRIYSDFAHHPTAIKKTIEALREDISKESKLLIVIEPKSNTMKSGIHQRSLENALANADNFLIYDVASLEWVANFAKKLLINS